MIASLPMYVASDLAPANSRFWQLIHASNQAHGIPSVENLSPVDADLSHWEDAGLLFSQTCGLPFRARLHSKVYYLGTPDYGLPDCKPGYYNSVMVAREDDPREALNDFANARWVINEYSSQSGFAAGLATFQKEGLEIAPSAQSGAHLNSLQHVREGKADFAFIDAVTWRFVQTQDLRIVGRSPQTPGLPFICAKKLGSEARKSALIEAVDALQAEPNPLGILGLQNLPLEAYLTHEIPEKSKQVFGI